MQRTWTDRFKRIIHFAIPVLVFLSLIAIDQITKYYFKNLYETSGKSTVVIEDFFTLTYVINTGAAWSFLANVSWAQTFFKILTCISLVLFSLFYIYAEKNNCNWLKYSIVLIVSGTIGNFIDRLLINGVIDFLSFTFWGWGFPVFNFADSCLTVGVIMLIIHYCFIDKDALFSRKNKEEKVSDEEEEQCGGDN